MTQTTAAPSSHVLLPAPADARDDALWGFVDETGAWVIRPQFENAYRFREGLAPVRMKGKWGYVDAGGTVVIKPQFVEAYYFNGGLARVATGPPPDPTDVYFVTAGKYGFIDKTGKMVIPAKWDDAGEFSEGLAPVMKGKKCGFIDLNGDLVIPLEFDSAVSFSEGLALASSGGAWGYVDKVGTWVIQPQYKAPIPNSVPDDTYLLPARSFHDGLAPVHVETQAGDGLGNWQYIDKAGNEAFAMDVSMAGEFSEGLAPVLVGDRGWGFVNTSGVLAIEPVFTWTVYFNHDSYLSSYQGFHQGLAAVALNGKVGYIDKTGSFAIPAQFTTGNAFSEGFAFVSVYPTSAEQPDETPPVPRGPEAIVDLTGRLIYQAPTGK